jgi:hypothetical protein
MKRGHGEQSLVRPRVATERVNRAADNHLRLGDQRIAFIMNFLSGIRW